MKKSHWKLLFILSAALFVICLLATFLVSYNIRFPACDNEYSIDCGFSEGYVELVIANSIHYSIDDAGMPCFLSSRCGRLITNIIKNKGIPPIIFFITTAITFYKYRMAKRS